jgi:hypothetical protein
MTGQKAQPSSALCPKDKESLQTKNFSFFTTTAESTIIPSSRLPQLRELTFQSSSSIHQDPVLGSEWLNARRDPVYALCTWDAETFTEQIYDSNETSMPADEVSAVYSQLGVDHVDSEVPVDELLNSSPVL